MGSTTVVPGPRHDHVIAAGVAARLAAVLATMSFVALALFVGAGRLDWGWAWVYLALCLVTLVVNGVALLRSSPETVAERGLPGATARWDEVVSTVYAAAAYVALPIVAALDERFAWSGALSPWWHALGALALVAGFSISAWAMAENRFFSTAVRVQLDRGHTVCTTGPYRFVRHPGDAGFACQSVGTALLLGSWWALAPAAVAVIAMVVRTALEDRLLHAQLDGYAEYAARVRRRLVPFVW